MIEVIEAAKSKVGFDPAVIYESLAKMLGRTVRVRYFKRQDLGQYRGYSSDVYLNDVVGNLGELNFSKMKLSENSGNLKISLNSRYYEVSSSVWIGVYQQDSDSWLTIYEPTNISLKSAVGFEPTEAEKESMIRNV